MVQSGIIQFLKKQDSGGLSQVELCNDINLNANQKMHYDRPDIAQKVTDIKNI